MTHEQAGPNHRFSASLVNLIVCPDDGADVAAGVEGDVDHADLSCVSCGRTFAITGGVLEMGLPVSHPETAHEQVIRDEEASPPNGSGEIDELELGPMERALGPLEGRTVVELGSGTGRLTRRLSERGAKILAVDISGNALQMLRVPTPSCPLGRVHADITALRLRAGSADAVVSTLVSNLPGRAERNAMYELARSVLRPGGVLVFGVHHLGLRDRLAGTEKHGRYRPGHIFRQYFTRREIVRETAQFFPRVRTEPMQVVLPMTRRLRLPLVPIGRLAAGVPGAHLFGALLLVRATR